MPRKYNKKDGSGYINYRQTDLKRAVRAVRIKRMTLRKAAEQYAIPLATLSRKAREMNPLTIGGQKALTDADEKYILEGIRKCADWGFPLTSFDVRLLIKSYLDSRGKVEKRFSRNMPGKEWAWSFLKRHNELSTRLAQNIKRSRAAVSSTILLEYFANLHASLLNVPVSNIINYDETNFTDDPGSKRVLARRGSKHPERVCDSSKTSISVMMAASADGNLLPPYTVYKASHMYPTWIEGGIRGSAYNRNKSGWFDQSIFEDWFRTICLPYFRTLTGPKVMIGDNLSSHLSSDVIKLCADNDVRFVLLPPNSTHLCQPLDVAFFAPLKKAWRSALSEWKEKNRGVLPKSEFPRTLKAAIEKAGGMRSENVVSGFRACGIFPFNPNAVISKVQVHNPATDDSEEQERRWTDVFVNHLSAARYPDATSSSTRTSRGRRLDVAPGKSVTAGIADDTGTESSASEIDAPNAEEPELSSGDSDEESFVNITPSTSGAIDIADTIYKSEDFVVIEITSEAGADKYYLGKILNNLQDRKYKVSFLRAKRGIKETFYVFPDVPDEDEIEASAIVMQAYPKLQRRNRYTCETLNNMSIQ